MESIFLAQKGQELKDTNFLEFSPSAHLNMAWDTLSAYERPALNEYLKPYLGEAFTDEIIAYANLDEEIPSLEKALYHIRLALAWYMTYDAFIDQNVQLTDLGPQQQSSGEGTSNTPSQWAFKTKRWNLIQKADKYTDQLLDYLDWQARAQDASFASYSADLERRRQSSDFFRSTTEVDEHLNIEGSRRAWASMVPYFRDAEWRYLRPILGDAFYSELATLYAAGTATEIPANVIKMVQRVIAKYGLMIAIPNISCVIQGDGIVMVSQRDGFDERVSSSLANNQTAILRLQQSTEGLARIALAELRSYIITNADQLPTYQNSPAFPVATETPTPIGDAESGAIFF